MSDVVELSKKLNETIKESEFYRNYLTCRERLYEHPDLLRGLNEFKKRNSEIQNRGSVDNPYDEVVALFEDSSFLRIVRFWRFAFWIAETALER